MEIERFLYYGVREGSKTEAKRPGQLMPLSPGSPSRRILMWTLLISHEQEPGKEDHGQYGFLCRL
jgi:hypothetical protein